MNLRFQAYPLADGNLSVTILDLVQNACNYKQLKKVSGMRVGCVNAYDTGSKRGDEELESRNCGVYCDGSRRRTFGDLVALASALRGQGEDAESCASFTSRCPQNVPYVFVASKLALGRACGVSRPVIACSVTSNEVSVLRRSPREVPTRLTVPNVLGFATQGPDHPDERQN